MGLNIDKTYLGFFGKLKSLKNPTAIVIHHTCTSSPAKTRSTLKKQGYSTHFEVDKDGTVYQYANLNELCAHCGSANSHCIGIDVTHLKDAKFTDAQIQSCKKLVEWLCVQLDIPQVVHENLSGIYPHRALAATVCPQNFPMEELNGEEVKNECWRVD